MPANQQGDAINVSVGKQFILKLLCICTDTSIIVYIFFSTN